MKPTLTSIMSYINLFIYKLTRKYHRLEVQYSRLRQSDPVYSNDADDTTCGEMFLPTDADINLYSIDQKNMDDDNL